MGFFSDIGGGDVLKVGADIFGAYEANERNSSAAKLSYKRQLYMSNTAVQRRVEDLKAAGLNPMLAYNDSASAGAVAQAAPAQPPTRSATVAEAVKWKTEKKVLEAQAQRESAQARQADTQANLNGQAILESAQRILTEQASAAEMEVRTRQWEWAIKKLEQDIEHNRNVYPALEVLRRLDAEIRGYDVNKAAAASDYYGSALGKLSFPIKDYAGPISGMVGAGLGGVVLKMLRSKGSSTAAKNFERMWRDWKP